jgi:hypothetical protein
VDDEDKIPGVNDADEIPGRVTEAANNTETDDEDNPTELVTHANELETALDAKIDAIDSDCPSESPESDIELDNEVATIDEDEIARLQNDDVENSDDDESESDEIDGPLPKLQRNRKPSYKHLKGCDGDGSLPTVARPHEFNGGKHQSHVVLQSVVLTQHNLKEGIKKFGNNGKVAVLVELQQLYDCDVMKPVNKHDLTPAERKGTLRHLMFLKEKRCGTIKGRGCADGRS